MTVERLQKILSNAGVASRREAEELVLAGRVAVNGKVAATLGSRADPEIDEITVDGVPVDLGRYRYFALHKPPGFVTTASDEHGRDTVLDLVPIGDIQLHPVGRLDMDSEGLLLITNDGHLTDLLTHPRYEIEKEYLVGLDAPPSQTDLKRLVRGIESDGDRLRATSAQPAMAPAAAPGEPEPAAPAWLLLTLREGKKREIRRMMDALGRRVVLLRRIRIGPLRLGMLNSGSFRELEPSEVLALYAAAKQSHEQGAAKVTPRKPMAGGPAQAKRAESARSGDARPRTAAPKPPAAARRAAPRPSTGTAPRSGSPGRRPEQGGDDAARGQRVAPPRGAPSGPRRSGAGTGPQGPTARPGGPTRDARGRSGAGPAPAERRGRPGDGTGAQRERPGGGASRGPGGRGGPAPRGQRGQPAPGARSSRPPQRGQRPRR